MRIYAFNVLAWKYTSQLQILREFTVFIVGEFASVICCTDPNL
jgi:hypothetical protein